MQGAGHLQQSISLVCLEYISFSNRRVDDFAVTCLDLFIKYLIIGASFTLHEHCLSIIAMPNQWQLHCLFNGLFRHTSKKTSKLCAISPLWGELLVTGGFPLHRASNAENVYMSSHPGIWGKRVLRLEWGPFVFVTFSSFVCIPICNIKQVRGQVITSHRYCGMWLLVPALGTCFWHTTSQVAFWGICGSPHKGLV